MKSLKLLIVSVNVISVTNQQILLEINLIEGNKMSTYYLINITIS